MSDTAYALLRKLLERAERGSDQPLTLNRRSAPEYFAISDPEVRDALHAVLTNAQAAGAVKLEWGKYEAAQDLQRIRRR